MLIGIPLDKKIRENKIFNIFFGLYPIYILFSLTTIIFSNGLFMSNSCSYILMVVVTTYTVLLFAFNILTFNFKCNKIIGFSFVAICLCAAISYLLTNESSLKAREYIFMIPINGIVLACAHCEYTEEERIKPFIAVLAAFSIAISVWNILNPLLNIDMLGESRLAGMTSHPARLGEMTSTGAITILSLLFISKNKITKLTMLILLSINCVTLYFANSRGAWLAFFTGTCVFLIIFAKKLLPKKIFTIGVIILFCIILFLAFNIIFSRMDFNDFTFDYSTINSLSTGRLPIYMDGINLFSEHPIIGHAMEDFSSLRSNYTNTQTRYHFHNIYLDIAVRYGIFAFIAFAVLTISIFFLSIKYIKNISKENKNKKKNLSFISAFAIFCCIMVQNQFDVYIFFNGYSANNCFFYISTGILTYFISTQKIQKKTNL